MIALEGRGNAPSAWSTAPGEPPVLTADPAAGLSMTQAARDALRRVDTVLAENSEPLRETIANLKTFSAALARNSDRLDGIVAGVERMAGGGPADAPPIVYDLIAPRAFPPIDKAPAGPARRSGADRNHHVRHAEDPGSAERDRGADICHRAMERQSSQAPAREDHPEFRECEPPAHGDAADRGAHGRLSAPDRHSQLSALDEPPSPWRMSSSLPGSWPTTARSSMRGYSTQPCRRAADAAATAAALNEAFGKVAVELVAWATEAM